MQHRVADICALNVALGRQVAHYFKAEKEHLAIKVRSQVIPDKELFFFLVAWFGE